MKRNSTIKLSGPGLNDYFARELLRMMSPAEARDKVSGPALEALERVIAAPINYCECDPAPIPDEEHENRCPACGRLIRADTSSEPTTDR